MKVSLPLVLGCLAALAVSQQGCVPEASSSAPRRPAPEQVTALPVKKPAAKVPAEKTKAEKKRAEKARAAAPAADAKWIPREVLFGNPDRASPRISPDGSKLAYLAPVDGVLNVWVGPPEHPDQAKPVTADTYRGISSYFWAFTNQHILYTQDTGGDEDFHVYCVNLANNETKDLTPLKGVAAQIEGVSEKFPDEILVGLNNRDPKYHDLYRINITTGNRKLVQKNPDFANFVSDDDFRVRLAMKMLPDGGTEIYKPDGKGGWNEFQKIEMADSLTTNPVGFDASGKTLYMIDSRDRDTGALAAMDLETGKQKILADDPRTDVAGILMHPTEKKVQAVSFDYERNEWLVLDPAIEDDIKYLQTLADGEMQVTSRTLDDKLWTVAFVLDASPVRFYLYHRDTKKADFLFTNRTSLENLKLAKMHPVVIKSRDGLSLVSYLTLPVASDPDDTGRPKQPVPMVLNVHGGPWARDNWGYDPESQWLANRGYAVLSVNFRGSTGFGKKFVNAGNKEWARRMQDDLLDALAWSINEKFADSEHVGIMGGSYGGYATLVAMTMTPYKFACGVDIVGPSSLITLLKTIPPYWAPALQMFKDRVGDPDTDAGRKLLEARSPLGYVKNIQRPLLIGQGANDPRVKQTEADQIIAAMRKRKIPVTYVLFPDEGHGFARPDNRLAFYAVTEAFLAKNLGGIFQPIGNDFDGSTITVPVGADDVPGLIDALEEHRPPEASEAGDSPGEVE